MLKWNDEKKLFERVEISKDCLPNNYKLVYTISGVYAYADKCMQEKLDAGVASLEKKLATLGNAKNPNMEKIEATKKDLENMLEKASKFQEVATNGNNNYTEGDKVVSVAFFGNDYEKPSSQFETLYNAAIAYCAKWQESDVWTDERKSAYRNIKAYMLEGVNVYLIEKGFQKISGKHVDKFLATVCPNGYNRQNTKEGRVITDKKALSLSSAHEYFYTMVVSLCGGYIEKEATTGKKKSVALF